MSTPDRFFCGLETMAIFGSHLILHSTNPDADRAFLRDVLGLTHVDAGRGWLIFALPPAEIAVHPGEASEGLAFYLMTDDLDASIAMLAKHQVAVTPPTEARWGRVTQVTLPSGSKLGLYQPYHPLAIDVIGNNNSAT